MAHGAAQLARVRFQPRGLAAAQVERQPLADDRLLALAHDAGHEFLQFQLLLGNREKARLALRQVEDILHLLGQPADGFDDRLRVFAALRRKVTCDTAVEKLGEASDRGERRPEFVGHVGEEAGLHLVCRFQCLVAFAQGRFGLFVGRHVERCQKSVAIGQRYAREFQRPAIGHGDPASRLLAIEGGAADRLPDRFHARRARQSRGNRGQQFVGSGMGIQQGLVDTPCGGEGAVPDLQAPVRREHGERFEQAVERGRPGAQHGVPGRGKGKLFGPVFRDEHQAAIGHRLRHDREVRSIGKRPVFFLHLVDREPL